MTGTEIIEELKQKEDIVAEDYDGSYELVLETVRALNEIDPDRLDYRDLNLLYLMTVGSWKLNYDLRKEKIRYTNLPAEEKERLIQLVDEIKEKTENGEYVKEKLGMFGTGFYSFKRGGSAPSKRDINNIITMCNKILREEAEESCIQYAEDYLDQDVYGLNTPSLSQILHCLKPEVFPVLNQEGIELYKKLGLDLDKPLDIKTYAKNVRAIRNFRDENFSFKNYRVIDLFVDHHMDDTQERKNSKDKKEKNYFWVTSNPSIWQVTKIKEGGEVFYTARNKKGNKRRVYSDFQKASPGDKIIFYESTPSKIIVALGEVTKGVHQEEEDGELREGISLKYIRDVEPISWTQINDIEELADCAPVKNRAQGSLFKLTKEEYETIMALEEVPEENPKIKVPRVDFDRKLTINDLYFPPGEKEELINQITLNLREGKHIILTGPPGTGKSKLAKIICENYRGDNYKMVTATSDWSTFNTIGGYRPDRENQLNFDPGVFLSCFKSSKNNYPTNDWLILDEINRADIDKAFGPLFSALTGDEINLSYKSSEDKNIVLAPQEDKEEVRLEEHLYIVPRDWRLIATMNTFDKTSLYEMSYAFMRRFAFIPVSIPRKISPELVREYLDCWEIEDDSFAAQVAELWTRINEVRKIGPAIVEDLYKYMVADGDLASAIINYVLPQFEGAQKSEIDSFTSDIKTFDLITEEGKQTIEDFKKDYFRLGGPGLDF